MHKRIMVVDDEPMIATTIYEMLHDFGYEIISCNNGRECIDTLQKGFKGVILMDVNMPDMDGWDTIREIVDRRLNGNTVISMLTGLYEPDEKMDRLKEYVMGYIRKPFNQVEFRSAVEGLFDLLD